MPRSPPSLIHVPVKAGTVALWDWHARPTTAAATIVLIHATGFHSRCWDAVVQRLPERFRCVCLDVPGHGLSSPLAEVSWREAANLLASILTMSDINIGKISVLVGHSMGGYISTMIANLLPPQHIAAMLLIDPVIRPSENYQDRLVARKTKAILTVSKRKSHFLSSNEMFERFKDRFPYSTWRPNVLRDYCDHGLGKPGPDGARPLLCQPAIEAENYVYSSCSDADPSAELRELKQHVTILRAPAGSDLKPFEGSPTDPMLVQRLGANTVDVLLEDCNHFIPMMRPEVVSVWIERLVGTTLPARL